MSSHEVQQSGMKIICRFLFVFIALVGCSGQDVATEPSPEQLEESRQQYIKQSNAFSGETSPGQTK